MSKSENHRELLLRVKAKQEMERRQAIMSYAEDFSKFAEDKIKVITKDPTKGFIPLELNEPQTYLHKKIEEQRAETGKVRAIILKARQQGISTYCAGRVFWKSYFVPHSRSVILAHDGATSDALFNMSKNLIKNMDSESAPEEVRSNAKEIIIKSPIAEDAEATSSYRLYTAGSPEAGRGTTPTVLHGSEVAFWPHDEKVLAGLFQGVANLPGTEIILESTANGASGEFHRLWKGAVAGENEYLPIFLPWFLSPEYRERIPLGFERTHEEDAYAELHGLDDEQIYWRRLKVGSNGEAKFRQEYPATADEAFLVSGSHVFDVEVLDNFITQKPASVEDFNSNKSYFDDVKGRGSLEIWKHPSFEDRFIIGADTSLGVGQDYQCAVVMTPNREIVGLYRNNAIDPGSFGDLLFYLGRRFNNALMIVESNNSGAATLHQLVKMNYPNVYFQTRVAQISNESSLVPGFRTTTATKPLIIGNLKRAIAERDIHIPSHTIIKEMKDYVSDEKGATNAIPGSHDDSVIATALCLEALRTHADRISSVVNWQNIAKNFKQEETNWL